jgi:hypothetical protein
MFQICTIQGLSMFMRDYEISYWLEVLCKQSNWLSKTPLVYNAIKQSSTRDNDLYGDTILMLEYYQEDQYNHIYVKR